MKLSEIELNRFLNKINKQENGCWIWTGATKTGRIRNGKGEKYSVCTLRRKNEQAHRVLFRHYKREIQQGLEIDHLCRNTLCVNPDHLEAVTHSENVKRGTSWHKVAKIQKDKTHCPQGHEYTKENTYMHNNQRHCRECVRNRAREYQARKRAKAKGAA